MGNNDDWSLFLLYLLFSLPSQVCTVVSDADCTSPVQSLQCNDVTPTPECQMVLRQFFNNSGTFCINVSLTNDVSLAVTSAMLSVAIGKCQINSKHNKHLFS